VFTVITKKRPSLGNVLVRHLVTAVVLNAIVEQGVEVSNENNDILSGAVGRLHKQ
jgi:hypothetical protein